MADLRPQLLVSEPPDLFLKPIRFKLPLYVELPRRPAAFHDSISLESLWCSQLTADGPPPSATFEEEKYES